MRKKTRLALIGAALAVAGSGISVSLAGTAHATGPTVGITQTPPYSNGQSLTLTGSGFPFGAANPTGLQVLECSDPGGLPGNLPTDASLGCDGTTLKDINDPGGNVNTHFSVALLQSAVSSNIDCTSSQYCALWVGEDSSNLSNNSAFTSAFLLTPTAPTVTPQTFSAHIGLPINYLVHGAGDPIPALSASPSALPPGVTLTDNGNTTASLTGTPTAAGSYVVPVTASSTAGSNSGNITINVSNAPGISAASVASFPTFTSSTFTVTGGGFPAPTITESGPLPAGVTFAGGTGTGTGTLSGQPSSPGVFPVTFTASNGTLPNATSQTVDVVAGFVITTTSLPAATRWRKLPRSGVRGRGNATVQVEGDGPAQGTEDQQEHGNDRRYREVQAHLGRNVDGHPDCHGHKDQNEHEAPEPRGPRQGVGHRPNLADAQLTAAN